MRRLQMLLSAFFCSTFVLELCALANMAPPTPNIRKGPATWMGYGMMFMFFVVVVLVSIMPSKRGHQD
ncbi:hypothetical protein H8D29_00310 [PVC group bacterium]|nr:hypothetical protein [PVC group bacterium]MDP6541897.1 hypothetical protein [Phycisphaerales bacterium]